MKPSAIFFVFFRQYSNNANYSIVADNRNASGFAGGGSSGCGTSGPMSPPLGFPEWEDGSPSAAATSVCPGDRKRSTNHFHGYLGISNIQFIFY